MKPMLLDELCRQVGGRWLGQAPQGPVRVAKVTIDSRKAAAGDLFIAIRGAQFDGHDFLPQAAAAGCVAAIVESGWAADSAVVARFAGVIAVPSSLEALAQLAMRHRRTFGGRVIGVTGSVGKTTVKGMIHHILARHKKGSAAPKSFNNNIGVPLTILAAGEADEYIVCELGSNAPGEIAALTRIADPDIAVITAVGPSHLEKLGSIEGVAAEKAAILAGLEERGGVGVIWADSQPLAQAVRGCRARLIRFGADERADLRLTGWEGNGWSQRFQVDGRAWFTLPLPGRHNASNALAAIAAAMQLGLSLEQAGSALADVAAADMRLQARQAGDVTVINDAYNANPMSMAAAVEALNKVEGGRRVFVAGDMRELGADSQPLHVALGGRIAQSPIGLLVTVGTLGRFIAQGAQAAGSSLTIRSYATAADAAAHVDDWLKAGDTVLVKASRGVAAECIVERILARSAAADKHNGACPPVSLAAPAEASLTAGAGGRRP